MIDNYTHLDNETFYIEENIPGPIENSAEYQSLSERFNSQLTHNCECEFQCEENSCYCIKISGEMNYTSYLDEKSNKEFILLNKHKSVHHLPIIECNQSCKCHRLCGNRLVQYGPVKNLEIKKCINEMKGLGLFTQKLILNGTFVCEYAGEVITKSQALNRHNFNQINDKMNYIFCLQEHVNENVIQTFVDPSKFGNIGRYINHSCEPNCEILSVRVDSPIPKLAIFTTENISPETEITLDYGANSLQRNISNISNLRKLCLCGSSKCRNLIPYDDYYIF